MTPNRRYFRIMAGAKSVYAAQCFQEGFIGAYWEIDGDLTEHLALDRPAFNARFIPRYLEASPHKSKVAAGLACGVLFNICKGIAVGDVVLMPNGAGHYYVGEVVSEYHYVNDSSLPHRRKVRWYEHGIDREEFSQPLKNSSGSVGTVCELTKYVDELESLLSGQAQPKLQHADPSVEDPSIFALEKHLEDFLVANWDTTELGKHYDIYTVDGDIVGQQFLSDTGPIDLLCISRDQKTLLVVELKRGRASDVVVGQIQRYMGYVQEELAEPDQSVRGIIIALEDDLRLRRALSVAPNIDFYRYQVSFRLLQG